MKIIKSIENGTIYNVLLIISFSFFIVILLWFITFKANKFDHIIHNYQILNKMTIFERFKYELIPFKFNNPYIDGKKEFIYNMLIFSPFGIYLPLLLKKENIIRDLIICFLISLILELIQLFTLIGGFSTNDLIANTIGYFIGYIFYITIIKYLKKEIKILLMFILISILIPFIIYILINTITNLDIYIYKEY